MAHRQWFYCISCRIFTGCHHWFSGKDFCPEIAARKSMILLWKSLTCEQQFSVRNYCPQVNDSCAEVIAIPVIISICISLSWIQWFLHAIHGHVAMNSGFLLLSTGRYLGVGAGAAKNQLGWNTPTSPTVTVFSPSLPGCRGFNYVYILQTTLYYIYLSTPLSVYTTICLHHYLSTAELLLLDNTHFQ